MPSGRSSGLWRRIDEETVWLDAGPARAYGRTSPAELDVTLPVPPPEPVELDAAPARAGGQTQPAEVRLVPMVLDATAATAVGRTSAARVSIDDSAEIARLMALLPAARNRLPAKLPEDVQHVLGLIAAMKKKAA